MFCLVMGTFCMLTALTVQLLLLLVLAMDDLSRFPPVEFFHTKRSFSTAKK